MSAPSLASRVAPTAAGSSVFVTPGTYGTLRSGGCSGFGAAGSLLSSTSYVDGPVKRISSGGVNVPGTAKLGFVTSNTALGATTPLPALAGPDCTATGDENARSAGLATNCE